MFGIERLQAIRELIKEKKVVEVTYLSKELDVSEVTIRRDLDKLEKEGLVAKTYGGAILIEEAGTLQERMNLGLSTSFDTQEFGKFNEIAKSAAKLIEAGDTVFIGGSDMGICLVKEIKEHESLIVVTNNIEIAMYLYKESNHKVVILGGELDSMTGNVLEFDQLDELLIEKAFITVEGVDEQFGYTVNEKSDVRLFKKLTQVTRNMIVVAPGSLYNRRGLVKLAPLDAISNVISDKELPDRFKEIYFENNIKVHTFMLH